MDKQGLIPSQELGTFEGPKGEGFALVASRTGRSVAVRAKDGGATAGRIWHPLDADRRVEVEDRWRARGASWIRAFRSMTLEAWSRILPRFTGDEGNDQVELTPSSLLGSFKGPRNKNCFSMIVSRTGRTVAACLGGEQGLVVARAGRPGSAKPRIVYQGLHRDNPAGWKQEFGDRFVAALRGAVEAARTATPAAGGAST